MKDFGTSFIPFGVPSIGDEEIAAVAAVLRSGWIGMGPKCLEFEESFARYVGAPYARAVSSCTAALHLALAASHVGPGDEVITTPFTFVATVNAIQYAGAKPVLVDVDPETFNLDPELVRRAITEKTRAIMPVHFGGLACDMGLLGTLADQHHLVIVEDAAHAVGTRFRGKMIGGIPGSIACFSFYPNKNITSVEGGMVTTDSPEIAKRIELMRLHGLDNEAWKRYRAGTRVLFSEAVIEGFKYNMTDVQAAIGIVQLKKLEQFLAVREQYAALYDEAFRDLPCTRQYRPADFLENRHALHLYLIVLHEERLTIDRNQFVDLLRQEGIGATVHYRTVHLHEYFRKCLGYPGGSFPVSELLSERIVTLPLQPSMTREDAERVAATVRRTFLSHQR